MAEETGSPQFARAGEALLVPRVGVRVDDDGRLVAATSGTIEGVLETPATSAGDPVYWFPLDEVTTVDVTAGGTCTDGGAAMVTTAGKFIDRTGTNTVVGRFLTGTVTAGDRVLLKPYSRAQQEPAGSVTVTATALTDNGGGTADGTIASMAAATTLTDSTGLSGTHDDILAATTIPTITATNPAAPTAYTAHGAGGVPVTSAAATDLDTTAAALATLRGEVATYETAISALVVDVAAILAVNTVMAQNISDLGQKIIELVTWQGTMQNNVKELVSKYNTLITDLTT